MNKLFVSILGLGLSTAAVAIEQGDLYERLGTAGEYPTAFKTTKATALKLRRAPSELFERTENCKLKAGKDIGFAALQKTTQMGRYKAKNATSVMGYDPHGSEVEIQLNAGETVEELSYLAEGICEIRVNGKTLEASCPSNMNDSDYEVLSKLEQQNWYYLSCENTNGWALEQDLRDLGNLEVYTVTY